MVKHVLTFTGSLCPFLGNLSFNLFFRKSKALKIWWSNTSELNFAVSHSKLLFPEKNTFSQSWSQQRKLDWWHFQLGSLGVNPVKEIKS